MLLSNARPYPVDWFHERRGIDQHVIKLAAVKLGSEWSTQGNADLPRGIDKYLVNTFHLPYIPINRHVR